MRSKIITVGVPYDMFGSHDLRSLQNILIINVMESVVYAEYNDKIVNVAMRLPFYVVDVIRMNARAYHVTNIKYTASMLMGRE